MNNWNPDLNAHIMECSATVDTAKHTMESRDETALERAERWAGIEALTTTKLANERVVGDAMSDLDDLQLSLIGNFVRSGDSVALGEMIARHVRAYATGVAEKESGW